MPSNLINLSILNNNNSRFTTSGTTSSSFINFLNIYVCSLIIVVGIIGNMISFRIFLKSGKKQSKSKIITKNLLILLSISNSIYLVLFWYYSVFPRTQSAFFKKLFIFNSNVFVCKFISYWISIAICINSLITASFSLQRALVINFPLKFNNFKENNKNVFKAIIFVACFISTILPIYNLILTNLTQRNIHADIKCDIPVHYEATYLNLTIFFIILTLPVPFLVILISNTSILIAIDRNRRQFLSNRLVDTSKIDKSMRLTKILITISTSFVLLNFPYFIAWLRYALFRVNINRGLSYIDDEQIKKLSDLYDMVKITEIFNLFNYAFIGFLYFVSGRIFRNHLNSVIGLNPIIAKSILEET